MVTDGLVGKRVYLGASYPIRDPDTVKTLLTTLPDSDDTRSEWRWFRLANGDLVAGFFPQGEMFFETEVARDQDEIASEKDGTLRVMERVLAAGDTVDEIIYDPKREGP